MINSSRSNTARRFRQLDLSVDRRQCNTGALKSGGGGKEESDGRLNPAPGCLQPCLICQELEKGADETVSVLQFMPTPEVVKVQLHALGEQPFQIDEVSSRAMHYVFKPQIGTIRELVGKATGKLPEKFHYDCWIEVDATPRFAQFEGRLQLMGQMVRIEPVRPRLLSDQKD